MTDCAFYLKNCVFLRRNNEIARQQSTLSGRSGRWYSEEDEMKYRDFARMACCQDCCVPDAFEVSLHLFLLLGEAPEVFQRFLNSL